MADYKETQLSGKQWRRCYAIHIDNPLAPTVPKVKFYEADMVDVGGASIKLNTYEMEVDFSPETLIDVLDTTTLEPTGQQISEGLLYVLLFSKYIAAAKARDVKEAEKAAEKAVYDAEQLRLAALYAEQQNPV